MIPDEIQKVCEYLRDRDLPLPEGSRNTRRDSSIAEDRVVDLLRQGEERGELNFDIQQAPSEKDWYDVKIGGYYCDIKISNLKSTDNTNAKRAIYYFLTGQNPAEEKVPPQASAFFPRMLENESPDEGRDFYYIIIGKTDRDVFPVTLKTAREFKPSASNLPFQCNWDKNREPVERSWQEAKDYLLTQWAESLRRLVTNVLKGMPKSYPQYFRDLEDILRGSG
ncbi:MAG: hypothetical protein MPJ52_01505 [Alphaproteobacteria bacterium]|nr:hypothetical protein [Alphaproteobacteria bacterium]